MSSFAPHLDPYTAITMHMRLYREGETPSDEWLAQQKRRATWPASFEMSTARFYLFRLFRLFLSRLSLLLCLPPLQNRLPWSSA